MALTACRCVAVGAQSPPAAALAPSGRAVVSCEGRVIGDVVVYSEAPTVANLQRVPVVARVARALHVTTRASLILRYMLVHRGDVCTEIRRSESERILRAQPFLADASIYALGNDDGGVDLEVRTSDELSLVIGGNLRAHAPPLSSFLLGNANLAGQGIFVSAFWRDGDGFRDGVGGRVVAHQFLGRPFTALFEGERAPLGESMRADLTNAFLTDLQKVAFRVRYGFANRYPELLLLNGDHPVVEVRRRYADVGGIARIGPPGLLNLVGLSVTRDDEFTNARLLVPDHGTLRDSGSVPGLYETHRIARINLLYGIRSITFVRRVGLDALRATQDVPTGVQVGAMVGRSVDALGARDHDVFVSGDLFAGASSPHSTLRMQIQGEARHEFGVEGWDGILTTGRVTHHLQFSERHLNGVSLEFSSTYRQRVPRQLVLGTGEGGVRGYQRSPLAGGQRLVARAEQRFVLGTAFHNADVGMAVFADAGKLWAGDVPFGSTTGVLGSVGVSLLAAVPPKSARFWRLDFAVPVTAGAGARFTLTLTNTNRTGFLRREPSDVVELREPTVPSSIFAWP